ncbi:MAG: site-specific integrase [Deltaproteobacteria bacterium]|nr:site-specific integrase [Deltaproteobacteria bacterium]
MDFFFATIRSGNNSATCVSSIKTYLRNYLDEQLLFAGKGFDGIIEPKGHIDPQNYHSPPPYYFENMQLPTDYKLVRNYIGKLKHKDIIKLCDDNQIVFSLNDDFPKRNIRVARQNLIKLVGKKYGFDFFAIGIAEDILNEYLSSLDYDGFKEFFQRYDINNQEIKRLTRIGDRIDVEKLVKLLSEDYDIVEIGYKVGVDIMFEKDSADEEPEEKSREQQKEEVIEKAWNGLNAPKKSKDVQVVQKVPETSEKPEKEPEISKVAEEYYEEMKTNGVWSPKSELEKRSAIDRLIEIIGDLTVDKLSHEVARKYKRILMKLPANMRKDPRYRDLSIPEIMKLKDVKPIAPNTVNNNMSTVIAFMTWVNNHGYIKDKVNFFEGMKVTKKKKAQDERKPFSSLDLKKIFDPEKYLRETDENSFRYWVPLLGLFTGARINEICQLHVEDIKYSQKDGLWCLDINDKSDDSENPKKLKNKASSRVIPIHPKLIELGFINFVQKQKKSNQVRIFPELTLRIDGFYRKPGRWFNESYLRKKVGITDPEKSFHSFRHTVIDGLKQKGVGESYISEYVGHSSGDSETFGRYGKQYQPSVLMDEVVGKIKYNLNHQRLVKN